MCDLVCQTVKPSLTLFNIFPGEVLIDRRNIKDLDLKFLRSNIGAVSQEPSLFAGTIKDNLKVGKMDANDQEIQKAAVMSNAHSFISQLPNQYLTEVIFHITSMPCLVLLLLHEFTSYVYITF